MNCGNYFETGSKSVIKLLLSSNETMVTSIMRYSPAGNALFTVLKPQPPRNLKLPTSLSFSSSSTPINNKVNFSGRGYDALLLDAGGTLLQLSQPVEDTYASIGSKYGLSVSSGEIKQGFKRAFTAQWSEKLRYQGDGRPFWKFVVSEATGCGDEDFFEEVYEYYAKGDAWHLPDGAYETMTLLKDAGVKMAVVSNFDSRLRKLLKDLNVLNIFDAVIISSEVGYEKPDPRIFQAALDQVNVEAGNALHIGDDQKADKVGANAVGIDCWLWGTDVKTFSEIQNRIFNSEA